MGSYTRASPSVFYGWKSGKLQIRLPSAVASAGSLELTTVDRKGRITTNVANYDPSTGLRIKLKRQSLLVLEPQG